uniref:DnaJ heat shock protein family (Hsp40) member C5 gamma n=1 Tax=Piliocolobus tephrosceles TaxID=591936 RepID=A0A8C9GGW9_9PRIM
MSTVNEAAHRLSKSGTSLYAVLELKKGASPEDVKKSYRHLSSCVHCSLVAVSVVAAVFAVEHLNHHLSRIVGENISRTSRVSLQGQVRTVSRGCEVRNAWIGNERNDWGQVRWLMPVIPALWEGEVDYLRSGVRDQPGQHSKTLSLLKIQKLAGHGGTCL